MPDFYAKFKDVLRTPEEGADTINWLGVSQSLTQKDGGQFYRDRKPDIQHLWLCQTKYKPQEVSALWEWCQELCETTDSPSDTKELDANKES